MDTRVFKILIAWNCFVIILALIFQHFKLGMGGFYLALFGGVIGAVLIILIKHKIEMRMIDVRLDRWIDLSQKLHKKADDKLSAVMTSNPTSEEMAEATEIWNAEWKANLKFLENYE